ncbi:GNAT family N-acetyltransferase [Pedobacter vanadiisoli]|uniref:GNAT family N-acetyltransferase n=1 Tax=Pedobacter vanadiisoli TaxID=1761975 RepID=A0ABW5MFC1_9SPHI
MDKHQLQIEMDTYKIRQLHDSEAMLYKAMRLEAIQTEPSMFRCSSPAEADLTDEEWRERVKYPRAVFILLDNEIPIGMTSILRLNEDEAYLGQSYIKKEYRGKGLSGLLYKIRMKWASKLPLKRLTVSHRESNTISKAANQRLGFVFTHREPLNWLDGTTEDVLYYSLELSQKVHHKEALQDN